MVIETVPTRVINTNKMAMRRRMFLRLLMLDLIIVRLFEIANLRNIYNIMQSWKVRSSFTSGCNRTYLE